MQPTMSVDHPRAQTYEQAESILGKRVVAALRRYRWRYSLETAGFTSDQAHRLVFARWLYQHDLIGSNP